MKSITEREYKLYLLLVAKGIVLRSGSIPVVNTSSAVKTAVKGINKVPQKVYTIAQATRWEYVLATGKRKHVTALWRYIGSPTPQQIPNIGKNPDAKLAECVMEALPEIRDSETGSIEIYQLYLQGVNALDIALALRNYPTAEKLFELDLQPTEDFFHTVLSTAQTDRECAERVQFIAERMQPDTDDLMVAVKAENPIFVQILMNESPTVSDSVSFDKIRETAMGQYTKAVKNAAKNLRDSIKGTGSSRGRIALLESELKTVKGFLKKTPNSQYYQARLDEIPKEVVALNQQSVEYERCFKRPQECNNSTVKNQPIVKVARAVLAAVNPR